MIATELMDVLAKAIEKNPKIDVYLAISKKDVETLGLEKIEDTGFFDVNVKAIPEEDIAFIFIKKDDKTHKK